MLQPICVTPPEATAVAIADVRAHLRLGDDTAQDTQIGALVGAATDFITNPRGDYRRALVTQTWKAFAPGFGPVLRLPVGPVQSVSSITYFDPDGVEQTLDSDIYLGPYEDAAGAYLRLAPGASLPATAARDDALAVEYVAGYGDAATDVPPAIAAAILLLVGHWFTNREAVVIANGVSTAVAPPFAVDALLAPYRLRSV